MKNKYSVIIPTMWKSPCLKDMIKIYNFFDCISEIILIDNKPESKIVLENIKIKSITTNKNIFVNPAWNWGVALAKEKRVIIANDDILIKKEDLEKLFILLEDFNLDGKIIGAGKNCFTQKGLILENFIQIKQVLKRNYGFGTFMILNKKDYKEVPNVLKIWFGDDFQIKYLKPYTFCGIEVGTQMSTTVREFRNELLYAEEENWKDLHRKKIKDKKVNKTEIINNSGKTLIKFIKNYSVYKESKVIKVTDGMARILIRKGVAISLEN